ncbi:MAG: alkaline phosphatase family protein [Polyangiaceae bacterium]
MIRRLFASVSALCLVSCQARDPVAVPAPHETPSATASAQTAPGSSATPKDVTRTAPIVVTLVVDQFAAWIASERLRELPASGGFARLRREGTFATNVLHAHAVTDTAPGHAALYTGKTPRENGIFANERFDGATRKKVSFLTDDTTRLVPPRPNAPDVAGASIAKLTAEPLADAFRKQEPRALIVSISLKDRGAIFGCGHKPDLCLWHDAGSDRFVTSTAFATSVPAWVDEVGGRERLREARKKPWQLSDEAWVKSHSKTADEQSGEGAWPGMTTEFPHAIDAAKDPAMAFRASPLGDEAIVELATEALQRMPFGERPALLSLSLSSNDYVGHVYGPDSWEAWDNLWRLDATLGKLFRALDAKVGPQGWKAILSADHGGTPMIETADVPGARPWCSAKTSDPWQRPCAKGVRLMAEPIAERLDKTAETVLGKGAWVAGVIDPFVYLTPNAKALDAAKRNDCSTP